MGQATPRALAVAFLLPVGPALAKLWVELVGTQMGTDSQFTESSLTMESAKIILNVGASSLPPAAGPAATAPASARRLPAPTGLDAAVVDRVAPQNDAAGSLHAASIAAPRADSPTPAPPLEHLELPTAQ